MLQCLAIMEIIWHGQNCFTFKGTSATVVTDPYSGIGTLKADMVTVSQDDPKFNALTKIEGAPRIFDWPGEYEASGVLVMAIDCGGKRIFHIEMEGIRFLHLGTLNTQLTESMIEQLGEVDVLLIPVGGGDALDAKGAHEVIEQIEPRIVIPMGYQSGGVEPFLKEIGAHMEPQDKFVIKGRGSLPEETTQFVVLNPQLE